MHKSQKLTGAKNSKMLGFRSNAATGKRVNIQSFHDKQVLEPNDQNHLPITKLWLQVEDACL